MEPKVALRWAALYRAASWGFGLVFVAFLGLALRLGLADVVAIAVSGDPYRLLAAWVVPPVLLAVLGFALWQLGSTAAYVKTTSEAVDEQLHERFDPEVIKSEILSVLDDRLAEMHSELERTRRGVEELDGGAGRSDFEFEE